MEGIVRLGEHFGCEYCSFGHPNGLKKERVCWHLFQFHAEKIIERIHHLETVVYEQPEDTFDVSRS